MKNLKTKFFCVLVVMMAMFSLSGCAGGGIMSMYGMGSGAGMLYTNTKTPALAMSANIDPTAKPVIHAEGSNNNILGLFVFGDASLNSIMQSKKITKIHHIDTAYFNVMGLYGKTTIDVYGE